MSPDEWWQTLAPDRREQIYRWITQNRGGALPVHPSTPGQIALITEEEALAE